MSKINEVITLTKNEGLEIDFSRIVYNAETETGEPSRPSWTRATLSLAEIVANVHTSLVKDGVVCEFTEDALEEYLKKWLEYHFNCGIRSFRWMWDKYRNFKAA